MDGRNRCYPSCESWRLPVWSVWYNLLDENSPEGQLSGEAPLQLKVRVGHRAWEITPTLPRCWYRLRQNEHGHKGIGPNSTGSHLGGCQGGNLLPPEHSSAYSLALHNRVTYRLYWLCDGTLNVYLFDSICRLDSRIVRANFGCEHPHLGSPAVHAPTFSGAPLSAPSDLYYLGFQTSSSPNQSCQSPLAGTHYAHQSVLFDLPSGTGTKRGNAASPHMELSCSWLATLCFIILVVVVILR